MEHTQGELVVGNYCGQWLVEGPTGTVANCGSGAENKANAERLVLCWNAHASLQAQADLHDELAEQLEKARSVLEGHVGYHLNNNSRLCVKCKTNVNDAVMTITEALAKAKLLTGETK